MVVVEADGSPEDVKSPRLYRLDGSTVGFKCNFPLTMLAHRVSRKNSPTWTTRLVKMPGGRPRKYDDAFADKRDEMYDMYVTQNKTMEEVRQHFGINAR